MMRSWIVSSACALKEQGSSFFRLWHWSHSFVQPRPSRASHMKNLTFGGALVLLSSLHPATFGQGKSPDMPMKTCKHLKWTSAI